MIKHIAVVITFFGVALLVACGAGGGGQASTNLEVDMVEFMYNPDAYTVPAGQEITIELKNSGAIVHDFVIMKLGTQVSMPFDDNDKDNVYWEHEVGAGQSDTVTFTAPSEPGEYQVVCGIPGHMEAGMIGTLTVVAP